MKLNDSVLSVNINGDSSQPSDTHESLHVAITERLITNKRATPENDK